MSIDILLMGESGSGKSTSIVNLPAKETFIINVLGKPLPFRGYKAKYKKLDKDGGNMFCSDDFDRIADAMDFVNTKRLEIKYLVLDDLGYTIMNQFMRKATQKGYDKYSELGKAFQNLCDKMKTLRDDLFCIAVMHVETDNNGKTKPKTVGKMIDQYVCIEGRFTYVFHTHVSDGNYRFITNNDGSHMAKTPIGMFPAMVDNDLLLVTKAIHEYENAIDHDELQLFVDTADHAKLAAVHKEESDWALANTEDHSVVE